MYYNQSVEAKMKQQDSIYKFKIDYKKVLKSGKLSTKLRSDILDIEGTIQRNSDMEMLRRDIIHIYLANKFVISKIVYLGETKQ